MSAPGRLTLLHRLPWLGVALFLGGMVWLSAALLRLESSEQAARHKALVEEEARLALWRLDSTVAGLIARESARPPGHWDAWHLARAWRPGAPEQALTPVAVPSPLRTETPSFVRLHFQVAPDGRITSPRGQSVDGEWRYPPGLRAQLDRLSGLIDRDRTLALIAERSAAPTPSVTLGPQAMDQEQTLGQTAYDYEQAQQTVRNAQEWQARAQYSQSNAVAPQTRRADVKVGPMVAAWLDNELCLLRRVEVGRGDWIQGLVLDWPSLRRELKSLIRDTLPEARLRADPRGEQAARRLSTLPVRLEPGEPTRTLSAGPATIRLSLALVWIGSLLAAGAAILLFRGIAALSERRAAFVSAVTHELRTPLTTFQVYTEMLDEGEVRSEEKSKRYVRTLRREAERLAHLVENVLAWSRLEHGRGEGRRESIAPDALMERIVETLGERCERAGVRLDYRPRDSAGATVTTDPGAVEQIVANLVDNACKYGTREEAATRIRLGVEREDRELVISVRDDGPGISPEDEARIFRPFFKSASEAAKSAPGVGLGLALCRRLAGELDGRLELRRDGSSRSAADKLDGECWRGAVFELRLPLDQA